MSPLCHKKRQNAGKHTRGGESKGVSTNSKTPSGQLPETAEKQGKAQNGRETADTGRQRKDAADGHLFKRTARTIEQTLP